LIPKWNINIVIYLTFYTDMNVIARLRGKLRFHLSVEKFQPEGHF